MSCHQCGKPLPDSAKYCPSCGVAIPVVSGMNAQSGTDAFTPLQSASDDGLAKYLNRLTWSLVAAAGGFTTFIALAPWKDNENYVVNLLAGVAVLLSFVASIAFYVLLGTLAARLKRSVITWVGLSVITNPIGPIVAYFNMRGVVGEALALQREAQLLRQRSRQNSADSGQPF